MGTLENAEVIRRPPLKSKHPALSTSLYFRRADACGKLAVRERRSHRGSRPERLPCLPAHETAADPPTREPALGVSRWPRTDTPRFREWRTDDVLQIIPLPAKHRNFRPQVNTVSWAHETGHWGRPERRSNPAEDLRQAAGDARRKGPRIFFFPQLKLAFRGRLAERVISDSQRYRYDIGRNGASLAQSASTSLVRERCSLYQVINNICVIIQPPARRLENGTTVREGESDKKPQRRKDAEKEHKDRADCQYQTLAQHRSPFLCVFAPLRFVPTSCVRSMPASTQTFPGTLGWALSAEP